MRITERFPSLAVVSLAAALSTVLFAAGCGPDDDAHDGHDHRAEPDGHDDGDGFDDADGHADEHADGDDEPEPEHVDLTPEQRRRIGLEVATAGSGRIEKSLRFPGEVVLNPDRVAHVVPRAAGIVREVRKTIGDRVEADEILAWIESAELAQAKLDFYAREADVGRSMVDLPRARQIFENVNRLLTLLDGEPSDTELAELSGLEMGDYRGKLLTARAEHVAAGKVLEREQVLRDKDISSAQDLVAATAAFQRARAEFEASMDTARFEVLAAFVDAARARQLAEFGAVAAEQMLRLRGVDDASIEALRALTPASGGLEPCDCPEPVCEHNTLPSVRERLGSDERFGWYPLRAPLPGIVIEKHLTLGEKVDGNESVFEVADTSTVWIELSVFQKDVGSIEPGQPVAVDLTDGRATLPGSIAYVAPIVSAETRTTRARVVLENEDDAVRPGLFVTVRVSLPSTAAAVVVPRSAVQVLDEHDVVFVEAGDGFAAVRVGLGRGDREVVEITTGLDPGARYVRRGAFELKAKIATSGLGAHAGHGH